LAAAIRKARPKAQVEIIPGGRGDFTVMYDALVIWDKHKTGRFPEPSEILDQLC
jgi:predicted Rdx family selenoprotein